jgi:Predicted membrane protein
MIRRQLAIFLVVGSLTVLVDFLTYRCLIWMGLIGINMAKAAGFLIGTVFAYFANRFWTFGNKPHAPGSPWRFAILYAATLGANVFVNALVLVLLAGIATAIQVAFLLATGVSASLNFLGMKLFVFKNRPASEML